jgi:Flp pilus assembly protein TadD
MMVDGTVRVVTCLEWATQKLSAEDLVKFTAAQARNTALRESQRSEGLITVNTNVEGNPDVLEVQFNNTAFMDNDPEYVTFMDQMLTDPDVTWPGTGIRPVFY